MLVRQSNEFSRVARRRRDLNNPWRDLDWLKPSANVMGQNFHGSAVYITAPISNWNSLSIMPIRTSTSLPISIPRPNLRTFNPSYSPLCRASFASSSRKMADQRIQMLLERNKYVKMSGSNYSSQNLKLTRAPTRKINTPLSPPALADVRKRIRGSGAGGLVICMVPFNCFLESHNHAHIS